MLPTKFECDDVVAWLPEFDAYALANGWNDEHKIKKLPAYLNGRTTSHFYAIPDDQRTTYAKVPERLKEALCPLVERKNFFFQFNACMLRHGEDPAVYKWELEQLVDKAEPTLAADVKTALLVLQFVRGLPSSIKGKLGEHNPTATLPDMLNFVQRSHAVEGYTSSATSAITATSTTKSETDKLVSLMTDLTS